MHYYEVSESIRIIRRVIEDTGNVDLAVHLDNVVDYIDDREGMCTRYEAKIKRLNGHIEDLNNELS